MFCGYNDGTIFCFDEEMIALEILERLNFEECEQWDSVSHLALVSVLEKEFEERIADVKILDLLSYAEIQKWVEDEVEK